MVVIGVTDDIDYNELRVIASSECDILNIDYFDAMDRDMEETIEFICGCKYNVVGYTVEWEGR